MTFHTRTPTRRIAIIAMLFTGAAEKVNAQSCPPQSIRYRQLDLGPLGFDPEVDRTGTFGINDRGQVAFARLDGSVVRAAIFLPCVPEPGSTLIGVEYLPGATPSIARDLNVHGQVVGQVNGKQQLEGEGAVWTIADPLPLLSLVDTFGDPGVVNDWSRLVAITSTQPAYVAGESAIRYECFPCSSGIPGDVIRAFKMQVGAALGPPLVPLPCGPVVDSSSHARDINAFLRVVGSSSGFSSEQEQIPGQFCKTEAPCEPPETLCAAADWPGPSPLIDFTSLTSHAYGTNDLDEIVGFRYVSSAGCPEDALFWSTPAANPVLLPPASRNTRAFAINEADNRQVVGTDRGAQVGVTWSNLNGSSGTWCFNDLNDITCVNGRSITAAHDVNDSGWIVGVGDGDPGNPFVFHAFLLYPCPADTNHDFIVDIDDLINVIILCWGGDGIDCPTSGNLSDIDCSGTVDVDDLIIVNASMGCCPGVECCSEAEQAVAMAEQFESVGLQWPIDWIRIHTTMADGSEQEQMNLVSWLRHYLSGECSAPSDCAGADSPHSDPFGNH